VVNWLLKQRWKKIAWASVSSLKFAAKIRARAGAAAVTQKIIRMYLARSVHKPRYIGIRELGTLRSQIPTMHKLIEKIKGKEKIQKTIEDISAQLDAAVNRIKASTTIDRPAIQKDVQEIQGALDKTLQLIKKEQEKQKLAEEAERLKKLAEEMEKERFRKEKEEAERKSAEEEARMLREMELQRKTESEVEDKRLEAERIQKEKDDANKKLQEKRSVEAKKEAEEAALLEQERRHQELAMRLAQDAGKDASKVFTADSSATAKRAVAREFSSKAAEAIHKKHDLSKWKYADLRDTINTSCDIELLEACREEFHRRLKVYHAWKLKNQNKNKADGGRAPSALEEAAKSRTSAPPPPKKKAAERPQRFFRIPFVRPGDQQAAASTKASVSKKRGWWYAHFDGQWIARQMELHPDKPPVLLVAGKDDMEMCELSLEETGLSRKRGAEILPREFEDEWARQGGQPYVRATTSKKK
jgi:myosin-6